MSDNATTPVSPTCSLASLGVPLLFGLGMLLAQRAGADGAGAFMAAAAVLLITGLVCGALLLVLTIAAVVRRERLMFIPFVIIGASVVLFAIRANE